MEIVEIKISGSTYTGDAVFALISVLYMDVFLTECRYGEMFINTSSKNRDLLLKQPIKIQQ